MLASAGSLLWLAATSTAHAAPETLVWQGRIVDASGAPVDGAVSLTLALYDDATAGNAVGTPIAASTTANDGYVAVELPGLGDALATDAPLWIEVRLGSTPLTPRHPVRATPYAVLSSRITTQNGGFGGACSDAGAIRWDAATNSLRVCTGTEWARIDADGVGERRIELAGSSRRWDDGSYAPHCNAYRNPTTGGLYEGDTGSGLYAVQPVGEPAPIDVYCDMSTATGWTLVGRIRSNSNAHGTTGAVGALTSPSQTTVAKLSDVTINRLRGTYATSGVRFQCGAGTTHFQENKAFVANGGGTGALLRCSNAWPGTAWQDSSQNAGHRGLNTWITSCEYQIYLYDGEQNLGCWQGGGDEKDGTIWVTAE